MARKPRYAIEKTPEGEQYILPGAERQGPPTRCASESPLSQGTGYSRNALLALAKTHEMMATTETVPAFKKHKMASAKQARELAMKQPPSTFRAKQIDYASDGSQLVVPGAERISTGELIARKMAEPIKPKARQRSLRETALFGAINVIGES